MATRKEGVAVRSRWIWRVWLVACLVFFWLGIQNQPKRGLYFVAAVVCGVIAARRKP